MPEDKPQGDACLLFPELYEAHVKQWARFMWDDLSWQSDHAALVATLLDQRSEEHFRWMMEQEKPGLGRAAETIFGWAIQDNQSEAVKLRMDSDITKPDPKSTGNATWVSWGDLLPKYNLPDFQALEFIRKGDLPAYDKEYSNRINRDSRHLTPAALTEIAVFREQDIFGLHGKDATDPTATHTKALVSWQNLIQRIPLFTVDGKTSSEQTASHSKKDRLLAYAKALIDSGSVNTRPELAEKVQKGLPEWKDNDPEYIIDLTRELWPDYTKYKPGRKAKRDT